MNAGWRTTTLGACCEIVSGATPSTGKPQFWDGDIAWATPRDLSRLKSKFISTTERRITRAGLESCAASVLPPDSVLFSSRAPIGHVAINTLPMATNQGFKSFVPNANEVDPHFLYHWLRSRRPYLESLGNGATFKEVSKAVVSRVEISLPPLAEQRRIAGVLDRADAIRRKRKAAIRLTDDLLRSTFLEMFGDPGTNPKNWPVKPLRALIETPLRNGLSPASGGAVDALVLTLSAITRGRFEASAVKTGTFAVEPWDDVRVDERDFLICRGNGNVSLVGSAAFPGESMKNVVFPDTMIAARVDQSRVLPAFLSTIWKSGLVRRQIEAGARTTNGTFKINQGVVESISIVCPPISKQQAFADVEARISRNAVEQQEALRAADTLFDALVVRAFSGSLEEPC